MAQYQFTRTDRRTDSEQPVRRTARTADNTRTERTERRVAERRTSTVALDSARSERRVAERRTAGRSLDSERTERRVSARTTAGVEARSTGRTGSAARTTTGRTAATGTTVARTYTRSESARSTSRPIQGRSTNTFRGESTGSYTRQLQDPVGMGKLSIIEGSAARQLEPERRERPYDDRESQRRKASNAVRLPMSLPVMIAMTFGIICVGALSVIYLQMRTDVTVSSKQVVALEKQYEELADSNDKLELSIVPLTDYSYIYEAATELGMQTPDASQILTYDADESEYIVQYESIPSSED